MGANGWYCGERELEDMRTGGKHVKGRGAESDPELFSRGVFLSTARLDQGSVPRRKGLHSDVVGEHILYPEQVSVGRKVLEREVEVAVGWIGKVNVTWLRWGAREESAEESGTTEPATDRALASLYPVGLEQLAVVL